MKVIFEVVQETDQEEGPISLVVSCDQEGTEQEVALVSGAMTVLKNYMQGYRNYMLGSGALVAERSGTPGLANETQN